MFSDAMKFLLHIETKQFFPCRNKIFFLGIFFSCSKKKNLAARKHSSGPKKNNKKTVLLLLQDQENFS